jgi:cell fate (sporulation/competence/biofilm development) regulator YlbF (YheA/YmcA/DUF963 family)
MSTTATLPTSIEESLETLCAAIVADEEVRTAREQAEAFLADEAAVGLYREMMTLGNRLHDLHHSGGEVDDAEVEKFEGLRSRVDGHKGIQAFQEAQQVLQGVANLVNGFVTKTLERGRVPTAEEVNGGGCGSGCGCHQ